MIHVAAMALLALSLTQAPNTGRSKAKPPPQQEAPPPEPPRRQDPPSDEESNLSVIRRNMPQIENCYSRVRYGSARPQGEVVVEWELSSGGDVRKAQITGNSTGSAELADCILREVKTWIFPSQASSTPTRISHPFRFQSS
jgi:TonB family protein